MSHIRKVNYKKKQLQKYIQQTFMRTFDSQSPHSNGIYESHVQVVDTYASTYLCEWKKAWRREDEESKKSK